MKKPPAAAAAAAGEKGAAASACNARKASARKVGMDGHFPSKKRSSLPNSKAKKVAAKRKDRRAIQRKKSLKRL